MQINYVALKAAMAAAGYKVSEGEFWTPADAVEFRTFSHFVLGIDHSQAHLVTTLPQAFAQQIEASGVFDPAGDPVEDEDEPVDPELGSGGEVFDTEAEPEMVIDPVFVVSGAKSEAESVVAPAEIASEPAATASKPLGEGESTANGVESAQTAYSATTFPEDETSDDLEQARHDADEDTPEDDELDVA